MAKRKGVSASLRWAVFSRDGFACRYCGAQAGQEGVELHADHAVSVADGGTNTFDNLVTACRKCNGGKGARSCQGDPPSSDEVLKRINERTELIQIQARAIAASIKAQEELSQMAISLKCQAYETEEVRVQPGELQRITSWCREFGADLILEWYGIAARNGISESLAIRYVSGIARNIREQREREGR